MSFIVDYCFHLIDPVYYTATFQVAFINMLSSNHIKRYKYNVY